LRTLGEVLFELGRSQEALPYLREAAELFAQLEDVVAEADMWTRVATAHERNGLPVEALEVWKRVQRLCRRSGDARSQLDALEGIARSIRQIEGATDASISAFQAALDLASTVGEWSRALGCRNTLGVLEWTRGRYSDALAHYEAALLVAREQQDATQEGVILNSLGVTLTRLNRPEEARTVLEESVTLNRSAGQRLLEAHALAGLGHVSRALGRIDRAVECFQQSRELRSAAGDRSGEAWMWRRLAETYHERGDHAAATDAAATAAIVAAASGDPTVIAACEAPLAS
jgi:tetratricopeptide (TPR) repeat protein